MIRYPYGLLKPIRTLLEKREQELKERERKLKKEDPYNNSDRQVTQAAVDDAASERFDHDRVAAMRQEIGKTLIRVRKALTRIKVGTYGTCEMCKKMIDTDRLAIDPSAVYCIDCERKREKSTV